MSTSTPSRPHIRRQRQRAGLLPLEHHPVGGGDSVATLSLGIRELPTQDPPAAKQTPARATTPPAPCAAAQPSCRWLIGFRVTFIRTCYIDTCRRSKCEADCATVWPGIDNRWSRGRRRSDILFAALLRCGATARMNRGLLRMTATSAPPANAPAPSSSGTSTSFRSRAQRRQPVSSTSQLSARFTCGEQTDRGRRVSTTATASTASASCPTAQGEWRYETHSNRAELNGKTGAFTCAAPVARTTTARCACATRSTSPTPTARRTARSARRATPGRTRATSWRSRRCDAQGRRRSTSCGCACSPSAYALQRERAAAATRSRARRRTSGTSRASTRSSSSTSRSASASCATWASRPT